MRYRQRPQGQEERKSSSLLILELEEATSLMGRTLLRSTLALGLVVIPLSPCSSELGVHRDFLLLMTATQASTNLVSVSSI